MRIADKAAKIIALFAIHLSLLVANAQPFFTSKQWHVTDGLPSEIVHATAQTSDHYLWIGTTAGLLRFDGTGFMLYNHQNTPELTSDHILCLLVTADGALWIGSESGGAVRYAAGHFKRFGAEEGITNGLVLSFFEDRQHTLWVGTDGGVFTSVNGGFRPVNQAMGVPPTTTYSVFRDAHDSLWLGGRSLLRVEGGKVRGFDLDTRATALHVHSIIQADDGVIWAGTSSGLYSSTAQGRFVPVPSIKSTVLALTRTRDGTIWVGTVGDGLYVMRPGSSRPDHVLPALGSKVIFSISEDAETNIWVGTQGGLLRLSRTPVNILPVHGAADSDFGSLMRDSDAAIWMCSTQLFRRQDGAFARFQIPALHGMLVRTLMRDRDGSLWVGTAGNGLLHLATSGIVLRDYDHQLVSNNIRTVVQARDGSIWVGTDSGVSHITNKEIISVRSVNGHAALAQAILEDRVGDIWVGTHYGLLHLHDGREVDDEITAAMQQVDIWSLHESSDRTLWIGTNNGLYLAKGPRIKHFTREQGLPGSPIYQILESRNGRFWFSSPGGVAAVDRRALESVAKPDHLSLTYYSISGDFQPAELFGSVQSAGFIAPAGDVWFPSTQGAVHILPDAPITARPFPIRITQVLVDGRPAATNATVTLPASNQHLAIDYAPVLLSSQSAVRFRVKLENFDKEWQEVSTVRTAYYTNLPPGRFTFRVAAYRMGDSANAQEYSLTVVKLAPIYRRPWFLVLCVVLAGAVAGLAYRLRLRALHSRFNLILAERNRVAREMHDTVIQGCTTISALLEAASSVRNTDDDASRELNDLARSHIESTIIEARKAVWNLRHGGPIHDDLASALAKLAEDATHDFARPVTFRQSGEPFLITPAASHELLMTAREAVHNALTHGDPATVCIEAVFEPGLLRVLVQDDGVGFSKDIERNGFGNHFGLQGMQERMRRIGAELFIESSEGQGTCVRIEARAAVCQRDRTLEEL